MKVSNLVRISSLLVLSSMMLSPTLLAAQEKVKVVASFSILGDMVRQVTGDLAEVTTIVGPDADAHVYTPSTADAKSVAHAEIIFVNGLGFETWSQTLIETSNTKAEVFIATNGITPLMVDGQIDPHAWNSLKNGIQYVANIADAMAEIDTINAVSSSLHTTLSAIWKQITGLRFWLRSESTPTPSHRQGISLN